jgi:hypothetical protein
LRIQGHSLSKKLLLRPLSLADYKLLDRRYTERIYPSSGEWARVANHLASRRSFLTLATGAAAAACVPFEETSPFWGTIGAGFRPPQGPEITREYVDNLPYASLLAWFKGTPKSLLVLGEVADDKRLTWYSAERQSITTFGPFVVGALGLEIELRNTILSGRWSANPLDLVGAELSRTLDVVVEGKRTQVYLSSTFELADQQTIEILGRTYDVRRVIEKVRSGGRPRYRNEYWVDVATGRCRKSRQTIVPTLPPLNLEVTKLSTI